MLLQVCTGSELGAPGLWDNGNYLKMLGTASLVAITLCCL